MSAKCVRVQCKHYESRDGYVLLSCAYVLFKSMHLRSCQNLEKAADAAQVGDFDKSIFVQAPDCSYDFAQACTECVFPD